MPEREVAHPEAKEHRGTGYLLGPGGLEKKLRKKKINISTNYPLTVKLKKSCIISARLSKLIRQ